MRVEGSLHRESVIATRTFADGNSATLVEEELGDGSDELYAGRNARSEFRVCQVGFQEDRIAGAPPPTHARPFRNILRGERFQTGRRRGNHHLWLVTLYVNVQFRHTINLGGNEQRQTSC